MTSKTVKVCNTIMKRLVQGGFTNQVSRTQVEKVIVLLCGGDPRTRKNWLKNLGDLEYLRVVNASVFEMNVGKVEGLLEVVVRQGQKKLL